MADIRALERNGFNIVSTFSGCGGSCLGFRMAGYRVLWANEFIPSARATYRANNPETPLDGRDIRKIQPEQILEAVGLDAGEVDVLEGSPPCASFSMAGRRSQSWSKVKKYSDTVQRVDDLFFEFARLLEGIQPRVFVAENVSGLVRGVAKGYFKEILARLKGAGYAVDARLLDAQWLGVPQARQRLIFVGVRLDLKLAPVHPKPLAYRYSVRDALPWIERVEIAKPGFTPGWQSASKPAPTIVQSGNTSFKQSPYTLVETSARRGRLAGIQLYGKIASADAPAPTVLTHGRRHTRSSFQAVIEPETDIARYAIGAEWDKMKVGEQSERYFSLIKPALDKPCPTLTVAESSLGAAGVVHPIEKRRFSIAELKRICGFPDDFILQGTYAEQWERLGRAVPPVMMHHIAATIRDEILERTRKNGHSR